MCRFAAALPFTNFAPRRELRRIVLVRFALRRFLRLRFVVELGRVALRP